MGQYQTVVSKNMPGCSGGHAPYHIFQKEARLTFELSYLLLYGAFGQKRKWLRRGGRECLRRPFQGDFALDANG